MSAGGAHVHCKQLPSLLAAETDFDGLTPALFAGGGPRVTEPPPLEMPGLLYSPHLQKIPATASDLLIPLGSAQDNLPLVQFLL